MPWHSQSISNLVSNEIRFVVIVVVVVFVFVCFVIGYNMTHGPLFYPIKRKILTLTAVLAAIIVTIIIFTSFFSTSILAWEPRYHFSFSSCIPQIEMNAFWKVLVRWQIHTVWTRLDHTSAFVTRVQRGLRCKEKTFKMPGYGYNCSYCVSSLIASFFTKDRLVFRPFHCHFKTSRERLLDYFGYIWFTYDVLSMSVCLPEWKLH